MSQPQIQIVRLPDRRRGGAKPYLLAGAVGVAAGLLSFSLAVLRRQAR